MLKSVKKQNDIFILIVVNHFRFKDCETGRGVCKECYDLFSVSIHQIITTMYTHVLVWYNTDIFTQLWNIIILGYTKSLQLRIMHEGQWSVKVTQNT